MPVLENFEHDFQILLQKFIDVVCFTSHKGIQSYTSWVKPITFKAKATGLPFSTECW